MRNEDRGKFRGGEFRGGKRAAGVLSIGSLFCALFFTAPPADAQEIVMGREEFSPGIVMVFKGAVADRAAPAEAHLAERLADVRIKAPANWTTDAAAAPPGAPPGGFAAYLHVHAQITNETTGKIAFVTLLPHVDLLDNLHYARNAALPGEPTDLYTVKFFVDPPSASRLAMHRDWENRYGQTDEETPDGAPLLLFQPKEFSYSQVNFMHIADAPARR